MQLLFKQRFFSWLDSYDIYNENGETVYTVEGKMALGHRLHILDHFGRHIGTVEEKVLSFLPKFMLYEGEEYIGEIQKQLTILRPKFTLNVKGWTVEGNIWEWDYQIVDIYGRTVATIEKSLWKLTDTYVLDIENPEDALYVLMIVLAIDAVKCSQDS